MAYPASIDELTDGVPSDPNAPTTALGDVTFPHDDHHRNLAVAAEAIETELGTDPAGTEATVKARLEAIEARRPLSLAPTGALAESYPRSGHSIGTNAVLSTGRLLLSAIALPAGLTITSISFMSGGTGLAGGTHQWFGLFNSSRVSLRYTTNDTSTAWSQNSIKTLSLTSQFVTTYGGLHYIGVNVTAGTVPTMVGPTMFVQLVGLAPIVLGHSTTGLTDPASFGPEGTTAAALTAVGTHVYGYVS
jgi:hypothetical protein